MRRHEAFHVLAPVDVRMHRLPGQHDLKESQEILRDLEIFLIAGMVEGDQDLVREAACLPRGRAGACPRLCCLAAIVISHVEAGTPRYDRTD